MKIINEIKRGFINYSVSDGDFYPQKPIVRANEIKAGIYTINRTMSGELYFSPMSAMTDNLVDLPNFTSKKVIEEVNKFWTPSVKTRYDRYGMVYKRGVLLHGKQGTGKSSIIAQLMEAEVAEGGIIFFCPTPHNLNEGVQIIREIQGSKRVLVIFEELEKLLQAYEGEFLSLLDGELQIDNVVYVATTNYLNEIPPRIKNRPSRFATVIEIPVPDADTRRCFITSKVPKDDNIDVELWVKATEGLTIDHIKDLIISVLCIGIDLEEAVKKIHDMNSKNDFYDDDDSDMVRNPYGDRKKKHLMEMMSAIRGEWNE